ncbi:MAG: Type II secretion system protein E [bacterium ADurb.Bin429]|nr:MAG: Type II secretion system protein E [bacterium ADurb.Bin429]
MRDDAAATLRPQDIPVPKEAIALIPRNFAERYRVCPLGLTEARSGQRTLTVATLDPSNLMLMDHLQQLTQCRINPMAASEQDIMRGIDLHYSTAPMDQPQDLLQSLGSGTATQQDAPAQQAPVGNLVESRGASATVESIMQRAISERATDIHIEPHPKTVYVRFRIDGMMYDHMTYDPSLHPQVISRIKILSNLNIAETRLPQDGRFDVTFGAKSFDVRISVLPSLSGEKAVMRLLPKGAIALELGQLGLEGQAKATLEELITKPFGMVLVTGPTGSGKTTTLYAALGQVDCVGKNVITVEDPVEYQFNRITQIQVHPKIGLTFAAGLRAILRQDPDVIMVGEIRDLETLEMAIHSALTGHLVLSTLHCNDAAAAAARMVDMGAEPFLVSSAVNGIVAQRLVRRVCEQCKEVAAITDEIRQKLELPNDGAVYYHGRGCNGCRGTGYMGRISVFEVITNNEAIQQAVIRKAPASEIRNIVRNCGFTTLRDDGISKARAGITTLEEVMRAVYVDLA